MWACSSASHTSAEALSPAAFSADSAYLFIKEQVDLGARVPGSAAHRACEQYLVATLERFGAEVHVQEGSLPCYNGEQQPIRNIVARYGRKDRPAVLLCAHWDCRPWCDHDPLPANHEQPVLGANDGASGVGVLLEMARQFSLMDSVPAVEIVFFDAEDMGTPEFFDGPERENTWCLGSQLYAASAPHLKYGILLDMVGAPDAVFPQEYFSRQYASHIVDKVWRTGRRLGFTAQFSTAQSYPITDDHYYINLLASVPCVDIIHYSMDSNTGFPAYWHTVHDDLSNVSTTTLHAVGTTVLTAVLSD